MKPLWASWATKKSPKTLVMCVVSGGRSLEGCLRFQHKGFFGHGMFGGYKDRNAKKV